MDGEEAETTDLNTTRGATDSRTLPEFANEESK